MIQINLLPWRDDIQKQQRHQWIIFVSLSFLLCLIILCAYYGFANWQKVLQQRITFMQEAQQIKTPQQKNSIEASLRFIKGKQLDMLNFLRKISAAETYQIQIIKIDYQNNQCTILGKSFSIKALLQWGRLFHFFKIIQLSQEKNSDVLQFKILLSHSERSEESGFS